MGMKQQGFLTKLKYKRIYALTARVANFFDLFNLSCLHTGTKIHTKDIQMISKVPMGNTRKKMLNFGGGGSNRNPKLARNFLR